MILTDELEFLFVRQEKKCSGNVQKIALGSTMCVFIILILIYSLGLVRRLRIILINYMLVND